MVKSRTLLGGAAWSYAAQVASMLFQFVYAAVTTRLINEDGFGAYSVALAAGSLAVLLATGGIGHAVGRMKTLDPSIVSALWLLGLSVGAIVAWLLWLSAPLWAVLWNTPASTNATRVISFGAFIAPSLGIVSALSRRKGQFRFLALTTLGSNVCGMLIGVWVVIETRSPASLVIAFVVSQWLTCMVCTIPNTRLIFSKPRFQSALEEFRFSGRLTLVRIYTYLNLNLAPWAVSYFLGSGYLGQWNRADVLSTIPLQQAQTVITQTLYPEFRHDRESHVRSSLMWPDLFALVGWFASIAAIAVAYIVPDLVPILFGPGWDLARRLIPYLAAVGGLSMIAAIMISAMESLGHFKALWGTQVIRSACIIPGICLSVYLDSIYPVVLAAIPMTALQIFYCAVTLIRLGAISATRFRLRFCRLLITSLTISIFLGFAQWFVNTAVTDPKLLALFLTLFCAALAFIILRTWRRWEPVVIAQSYGLIR